MKEYIYSFDVNKDAIDENLHVNNVMYVQWMQDAAVSHSKSVGDTLEIQQKYNFMWVAKSHHIEYIRPSYEKDTIQVRTWTEVYKKSASLRKYEFTNQNQELLAKAETVYVCIDAKTLRPIKIPENILSLYL
ncbi:MAG: acyl-CoA thioesterase [Campylobacteraceae bacterium]|nr:acyl-CoA thioesterase [Campylobacteraceae bacterium]